MGSFESLFFFSEESIREPEDDISWTARGLQAKRLTFKNLQKKHEKNHLPVSDGVNAEFFHTTTTMIV